MPARTGVKGFILRLPNSLHERAKNMAASEGISLNSFILLALTDFIARKETRSELLAPPVPITPPTASGE